MVANRLQNRLLLLTDRQPLRIADGRTRRGARLHFLQRHRHVAGDFIGDRLLCIGIFDFARTMQPALQALLITEHQLAQLGR